MQFEDLQKAWQSQDASAKVTINPDLLLTEVRRNQRQFQGTIFRRDTLEVVTCFIMTAFFAAWGWQRGWWSMYLLAFCCLVVGVFFVVDRRIQRRKHPAKNDTLQTCIQDCLFQVNHQIWLLRNILWWYLMPIIIGLTAVSAQTVWSARDQGLTAMLRIAGIYIFVYGFTYGVVYWANQQAVKKQLVPRRQELESLLAGLK